MECTLRVLSPPSMSRKKAKQRKYNQNMWFMVQAQEGVSTFLGQYENQSAIKLVLGPWLWSTERCGGLPARLTLLLHLKRARDTSTDSATTVKNFFPKWPQSPSKDPKTLFISEHSGVQWRTEFHSKHRNDGVYTNCRVGGGAEVILVVLYKRLITIWGSRHWFRGTVARGEAEKVRSDSKGCPLFLILSPVWKQHVAGFCFSLGWSCTSGLGFHRTYRGTGETGDIHNKYGLVFLGCDYKSHFTV